MKITVKETRVLKTGENKKGKWELIKVTSDDGTEYTTFDKKAKHLNPESIFEADVELKEGKASFSEVGKIISQGEAKPQKSERDSSTNASIEAQVAFKGMVELIATGMIKTGTEEYKATIRWAMARIDLPSVIVEKIEGAKGETSKDTKSNQETQTESTDRQDSRETTDGEPKTVSKFLTWLTNNGIKAPRTWLEVEYKVGNKEVLTVGKCQELYEQIKKDKGW